MSYVTVYAIDEEGNAHEYGEARNAWGGAMAVWNQMGKKYHLGGLFDFDPLWSQVGKGRFEAWEDILIASTFDRCYISREHMQELAWAWREFYETMIRNSNVVETSKTIAELLEKAVADKDVYGIAFNHTSVSESHWSIWVEDPEDEDEGEYRPYNVKTDTDHLEIGYFLSKEKKPTKKTEPHGFEWMTGGK